MSKIDCVNTDKAPAAIGPYSQATALGEMVFVSGQLGIDPTTGELVDEFFSSQTEKAMSNLKAILEAAGSSLENVLSVDVFMTDLANFVKFNEIYASYFADHKPARVAIEVSGLPKGGLVEIRCIAKKK